MTEAIFGIGAAILAADLVLTFRWPAPLALLVGLVVLGVLYGLWRRRALVLLVVTALVLLAAITARAVAAPPHPPLRVHGHPPAPHSVRWVGIECSVPELPDGTFAGELDCWDVYQLAGGRHPHRLRAMVRP